MTLILAITYQKSSSLLWLIGHLSVCVLPCWANKIISNWLVVHFISLVMKAFIVLSDMAFIELRSLSISEWLLVCMDTLALSRQRGRQSSTPTMCQECVACKTCQRKGELLNPVHCWRMYPKQRNLTEVSNHRPNYCIDFCTWTNKPTTSLKHTRHCHLKCASQQIPYTPSCILNLAGPREN